ncbi:hypothetical protein, partial [Escherichia coli]
LMMSLWDALRMNMMISYQELVRTFPNRSVLQAGQMQLQSIPRLTSVISKKSPDSRWSPNGIPNV